MAWSGDHVDDRVRDVGGLQPRAAMASSRVWPSRYIRVADGFRAAVPDDVDVPDRLVGSTGRDPRWTLPG